MDIAAWLTGLGLDQYAEAFKTQQIDAASLRSLTADDLREIGVASVGHRRRLLDAIAALQSGAPAQATAAAPEAGERRQVTVLFADLAGYTALSNEIGAEAAHAILGEFFARADEIVARFGGRIDKHIGDCVMAVFGAPMAHADDPERAVRAALAIRDAMPAVSTAAGRTLAAHVGVASGQVVASRTGSARHSEYTVIGETVNLASRLTGAAADGEVLVADEVYRSLFGRLDATSCGPLSVKGFAQPVVAWRVEAVRRADASDLPFFGRASELLTVDAVLRSCLDGERGLTLAIRGEAGIGKSRFLAECIRRARAMGYDIRQAMALDFGAELGRDPQRSLARSLLGLVADAGDADRQAAADSALAAGQVEAAKAALLLDLLNLPQTAATKSSLDAMDHRSRQTGRHDILARLATAQSRAAPVMICVEDVHWADADTLQALARLVRAAATARIVVAMTSRPEGDPTTTPWRAQLQDAPMTTVDLGPLPERDSRRLADALIGAQSGFAARCLERAGGNPLYLEQLLRHAAEAGGETLPGSLQSIVLARADRLPAEDKAALRAGSALGQRFGAAALRAVLGREDYDPQRLVAHFLLWPDGDELVFAHALIRDGIYDSLLQADRRALHTKAAAWFENRDAILHAEHADRAGLAKAHSAYAAAARAELAAYRYESALRLAERGRDLAPAGAQRSGLECIIGEVLEAVGRTQEMLEAYRRAEATADSDVDWARAWMGQAAGLRLVDRIDDALALLDRAEPALRGKSQTLELGRLQHLRGNLCFPKGKVEACRVAHAEALGCADSAGSLELRARALGGLGDAEYARGRLVSARRRFGECVELAKRLGMGRIEVANRNMHIIARMFDEPIAGLAGEAEAAAEAAAAVGHYRAEAVARHAVIMAALWVDAPAIVAAQFEAAQIAVKRIGARRFEAENLAFMAEAERRAGNVESARVRLAQALEICRETGIAYIGPIVLGFMSLAWLGRPAERRAALAEGQALLADGGIAHNHLFFSGSALESALLAKDWDEAERYAALLERPFQAEPLRFVDFLVERGRALAAAGRGDPSARPRLAAAAEVCRHLGHVYYLAAIERALAA